MLVLSFAAALASCAQIGATFETAANPTRSSGQATALDKVDAGNPCGDAPTSSASDDRLKFQQCHQIEDQRNLPWYLAYLIGFGALITAAFGVVSFFLTWWGAQGQSLDARLSQALEQLSNPNSAAIRASAAATLQILARPRLSAKVLDWITRQSRYSRTRIIAEQLATSLRMEPDGSVVKAIGLAILSISETHRLIVYRAITQVWRQLEPSDITDEIVKSLADRFGDKAEQWLTNEPLSTPAPDKIDTMLAEIANLTGIGLEHIVKTIESNQYLCATTAQLRIKNQPSVDSDAAVPLLSTFRVRVGQFCCIAEKIEADVKEDLEDDRQVSYRLLCLIEAEASRKGRKVDHELLRLVNARVTEGKFQDDAFDG